MIFSSLEYLVFLPIVFILYWTLCKRSKALQNYLLVAANCVFYAWWDWRFLGLLLLTGVSVFVAGKLMQRYMRYFIPQLRAFLNETDSVK